MTDKLAVVTGTSSGIGAALTKRLLDEGWTVVGLSRREAEQNHPDYQHMLVDLGHLRALQTLVDTRLSVLLRDSRWQRVGLVNNAALGSAQCSIEELDPEALALLLAINTIAPIYLMGFVVRTVPATTPLRIVNVSSGAASRVLPGLGDYCASKAALRMAGMALAAELASHDRPSGIRRNAAVLSYEPGLVDTPMQAKARSAHGHESPWSKPFKDFAEQGFLAQPEEVIGEMVDFLGGESDVTFVEKQFGA